MARFNYIQNVFNAGEFGEKLHGREELEEYRQASAKQENLLTMRQGGVTRRPGTQFVADLTVPNAANPGWSRNIPFVFSESEAYTVTLSDPATDQGLQIYKNDGTLATLNTTGTPFLTNNLTFAQLYEVQFAQSADVMWFIHPSHKPAKIIRTSADNFDVQNYDVLPANLNVKFNSLRVPFRDVNVTTTTLTPAATTGSGINVTASNAIFTSAWIGTKIRITHAAVTGVAEITAFTSTTIVVVTIIIDFGATTASAIWDESAWSDLRGWPRAITFHDGALFMLGNTAQPDTFWRSLIGNFDHFMQSRLAQDASSDSSGLNFFGANAQAADPFAFTIASQEVNKIQWAVSDNVLQIGTLGAEHIVTARDGSLGPKNIQVNEQTANGSAFIQAKKGDSGTFYVQRGGRIIRNMRFDRDSNKYLSDDVTVLNDQIVAHGSEQADNSGAVVNQTVKFRDIQYQSTRGILWCLNDNGFLVAFTSTKDGNARAWHRHRFGGSFIGNRKTARDPYATGVCSIPSTIQTHDELFVSLFRTINGVTEYYLEKIGSDYEFPEMVNESLNTEDKPIFSDSAVHVDIIKSFTDANVNVGTEFITITGHNYIDGDQVIYNSISRDLTGLTSGDIYFIVNKTANTFNLALTVGGAAINLGFDAASTGADKHTVYQIGVTVFSGFSHLEGETLSVLADGFNHPDVTVASGNITLNKGARVVIAGLKYTPILKLLRLEAGANGDTAQGSMQRIDRATVRFYKSYSARIGPSETEFEEIIFRPGDLPAGANLPLLSGDRKIDYPGGPDRENTVVITQDKPMPLTIIALILKGVTYD